MSNKTNGIVWCCANFWTRSLWRRSELTLLNICEHSHVGHEALVERWVLRPDKRESVQKYSCWIWIYSILQLTRAWGLPSSSAQLRSQGSCTPPTRASFQLQIRRPPARNGGQNRGPGPHFSTRWWNSSGGFWESPAKTVVFRASRPVFFAVKRSVIGTLYHYRVRPLRFLEGFSEGETAQRTAKRKTFFGSGRASETRSLKPESPWNTHMNLSASQHRNNPLQQTSQWCLSLFAAVKTELPTPNNGAVGRILSPYHRGRSRSTCQGSIQWIQRCGSCHRPKFVIWCCRHFCHGSRRNTWPAGRTLPVCATAREVQGDRWSGEASKHGNKRHRRNMVELVCCYDMLRICQ